MNNITFLLVKYILLGALPISPNLVGAAFTWLPVCHVVNGLVRVCTRVGGCRLEAGVVVPSLLILLQLCCLITCQLV
jgi:hypothetical protein